MRIILYTTLPPVGGNSTITLGLCRYIRSVGGTATILVKRQRAFDYDRNLASKLRSDGHSLILLSMFSPLALLQIAIWMTYQLFFAKRAKLFLSVGSGVLPSLLTRSGIFRNTALYYINHDPEVAQLKRRSLSHSRFSDLIVITPASLNCLANIRISPKRLHWLPQFSQLDTNRQSSCKKTGAKRINTFGFLGTFSSEKGIDVLIKNWERRTEAAKLLVVGDGPLKKLVLEKSAECPRIEFRGSFSASDRDHFLLEFFSSIDVLIVPTQVHGEGIPTVILEALAFGIPVVTTRLGGSVCFEQIPLVEHFGDFVTLVDPESIMDCIHSIERKGEAFANSDKCISAYQEWFSNNALERKWSDFLYSLD